MVTPWLAQQFLSPTSFLAHLSSVFYLRGEYLPYHGVAPSPLTLEFPLVFLLLDPSSSLVFSEKFCFPEVPPARLRASAVPHGELTGVCCPWHGAAPASSARDPHEAPAASSGHSHPLHNGPALSAD